MHARLATRLALLLSLAMVVGAVAADVYAPPTSEAFIRGIKRYPFVADARRRERIRAGVPQLTRCMDATAVRKLMGDPDYGTFAYRAGGGDRVPTKHLWTWILEKPQALEAPQSSRVVVWFDGAYKLMGITIHATPGLESNVSRREQTCPAT